MGKKTRILVLACVMLAVAATLAAVATFALWSSDVTISNHLEAGTLTATLRRTSYTRYELDGQGKMSAQTVTETADFTAVSDANMFGLTESSPAMVPGAYYEAALTLGNGGDVAFDFWVEIRLQQTATEFASQLQVTVTADAAVTAKRLSEGLSLGSADAPLGQVAPDGEQPFTVRIEFINDADNNAAMSQAAVFDLVIHAVQAVD